MRFVGCEKNLTGIREAELKQAQEALKRFLGRKAHQLIEGADSKELRAEAVEAVKQALARQIVSDIFFSSVSIGEAI